MRYLLLVAVLLTGCGLDPKYREAKDSERIEQAQKACEKIGYAKDSDEWRSCAKDIFLESKKTPPVINATTAPSAPKTTNCSSIGNSVQCRSY